jgi:putative ABC transport system permease protein
MKSSKRGIWLRQALVITQFVLSIFMIIATLVVVSQMNYIRNKSLGFNQENLIVVDINNGHVREQWETVRHEFSVLPGVKEATAVSRVPGEWKVLNRANIMDAQNSSDTLETYFMCFDENTLDVFEMSLLEGKNFISGVADTSKLIVNTTLVEYMGWEQAIGQELKIAGVAYPFTVIGVVDDFHFQSLYEDIQPMVIGAGNNAVMVLDYFVLKTQANDMTSILDGIAQVHNKFDNRTSVEIHFLDDELNRFYKSDIQAGQLFAFGAGLTIFISCLGLFGLISFFAQMKIKEVSIRKVLGASSFQLISLLAKPFIIQVGIGFIIASPLAWFIMSGWLNSYSYRISMPLNVFFVAALMAILVTVVTISYRAIKTSNVNPAKTLKQE